MPTSPNFDSVALELKVQGYAVLRDYLSSEDCALLKGESRRLLKEQSVQNPYGEGHRLYPQEYHQAPGIQGLFVDNWQLRSIAEHYWGSNLKWCTEVFVCHEFPKDEGTARQGYLHYDRMRTFKCFAYLTDTTVENGALHVVPGSHLQGRKWRTQFCTPETPYDKQKNRPGLDLPIDELEQGAIVPQPIEGTAGTMILFDSDLLHRGGQVHEGHRWVVRSHSR